MTTRTSTAARLALASALIASIAACSNAPPPKPPTAPTTPNKPMPAPETKTSTATPTTPAAPKDQPASGFKTSTASDDPALLQAGGVSAPKPATWTWQPPSGAFRTLQYSVPGTSGSSTESADLIVSVFNGAGGGGPIEGNISRWATQFHTAEGGAVQPTRTEKTIDGLQVTIVELKGTYTPSMGTGGPKPNQLQLGAIIAAPESGIFIRLIGPESTVEAERDNWNKLIEGLKKQG